MNKIAILEGYRGLPRSLGVSKRYRVPIEAPERTVNMRPGFIPDAGTENEYEYPAEIYDLTDMAKAQAAFKKGWKKAHKAQVAYNKQRANIEKKLKTLPAAKRYTMQKGGTVRAGAANLINLAPEDLLWADPTNSLVVPLNFKRKRTRKSRAKATVTTYRPRTKRKTSARRSGGGNAGASFTKCVQVCHRKFGRRKRKCPDNKFIRCLRKHKGKTNFRARVKRCMGKGWSWKRKK